MTSAAPTASSSPPSEPLRAPAPHDKRSLSPHLEEDGVDQLSADTFRAFIAAGRLHARLIGRLVDVDEGVHPGQFFCLRVVSAHDGISQRELADELHVAPPSISRMLQNMERAGLVERRDDERDQRVTRVFLTEHGRALDEKFRGVAARYVKDTIGRLSEVDRRELIRLLQAFAETLEAAIEARSGSAEAATAADAPDDRTEAGHEAGHDARRRDPA
jgi:DNA-binding MarR family transcriptional regulator